MMKCKKGLVAGVVAVCMMGAMGVNAFATEVEQPTTGTITGSSNTETTTGWTNVKYAVTEGYEWEIHSEIDFGENAKKDSVTSVKKSGNVVKVTKNVIGDGKKLVIKVEGDGASNAFTIKNGSTTLSYTITEKDSNIKTGANILEVNAGTNAEEADLTYTLNLGDNAAEIAGSYTGKVTYTASIVNQNN